MTITLKTEEEIAAMRVACRLASEVLDYIAPHVRPGITTGALDTLCHQYMVEVQQTIPAPLNAAAAAGVPAARRAHGLNQ